ncbi:MAG: sensor histidine kinase [Ferruginibacter sp.]
MRHRFLLLMLCIHLVAFCHAGYIDSIRQEITVAKTIDQKISAYDKWLPLGILVHHAQIKQDLDSFKILSEALNSKLANGIYALNLAYYLVEYDGNYKQGLELCIKAKDIFEKEEAWPQLVVAYNRLVFFILWNEIGKDKPVIKENLEEKYLNKALNIAQNIGNTDLQILTLSFIGSYINVIEEDRKKALDYFFKAKNLLKDNSPQELKVAVLESIAIVYADDHKEKEMLEYAARCEALPFFQDFGYGRSNMYRAIANMYLRDSTKNHLSKALEYANRSYSISLQMNAPEYISKGEQSLYEIFKAKGDQTMALFYLEKYRMHEDSLSRERFRQTYTEYDIQKKETLIATQKLDLYKSNLIIYGSTLITMFVLIFLAVRFKKYHQKQIVNHELAVKNAEEQERKRIAASLHDNLGVQANAILHNSSLLLEEKNYSPAVIANLQETAQEMLLNLRETVWAMKTKDLTAMDLWLRIINFMKQMGRNYKNIDFKIEGEVPANKILPKNKALNVILALQESINNAVKHANAATIIAKSSFDTVKWTIAIEDNGKGFDMKFESERKEGFGLTGLQERASAADFELYIQSQPLKGTIVTLQMNH